MSSKHQTIHISRTHNIGNSFEGDEITLVLIDGRLGIEYGEAATGRLVRFTLSDSETAVLMGELLRTSPAFEDANEIVRMETHPARNVWGEVKGG